MARKRNPPTSRQIAIGATVGLVTLGAAAIWYSFNRKTIADRGLLEALFDPGPGRTMGKRGSPGFKELPPGSILCPVEEGRAPPSLANVVRGDFVVLKLLDSKDRFVESTWAQIRGFAPNEKGDPKGILRVQLVGQHTPEGSTPLQQDKHGFRLWDQINVRADCVSDVLHHEAQLTGDILCGPQLLSVTSPKTQKPLFTPLGGAPNVTSKNDVRIVVVNPNAPKDDYEPLWVHVTQISPGHQVVRGIVIDQPKHTAWHGLRKFSKVQFTRDCIVDYRGGLA